ncbi:hypothetical protein CCACVL1_12150 [Corchorus capsularis]|uniref:Uncharacterized protein n=1 Tax=Corchorus capsularis TaxID=210143 RepID=A0A1R3IH22_COCAP|nr:hypothetical protein CCACVL1_12150 [Corchorus capsularis]
MAGASKLCSACNQEIDGDINARLAHKEKCEAFYEKSPEEREREIKQANKDFKKLKAASKKEPENKKLKAEVNMIKNKGKGFFKLEANVQAAQLQRESKTAEKKAAQEKEKANRNKRGGSSVSSGSTCNVKLP